MTEQGTAPVRAAMPRGWVRPMTARSPDEPHRVATPLELLFDLCFVLAVAQASLGLEEQFSAGRVAAGVVGYVSAFFAIAWGWMGFTFFASSYDTDDVPYRLAIFAQITGALVIAAGVERAVVDENFAAMTIGYLIMRVSVLALWVRAGLSDTPRRRTCFTYAGLIALAQVGWLARLTLQHDHRDLALVTFGVLVVVEISIPALSERAERTTFHPEHIADRFGGFTVIVLGEAITAVGLSFKDGLDTDRLGRTLPLAVAGLVIMFAAWWFYFESPRVEWFTTMRASLLWSYGHIILFAGVAATGAGLGIAVHQVDGGEEGQHVLTHLQASLAVAIPAAVFLLALHGINYRGFPRLHRTLVIPAGALLVVIGGLLGQGVYGTAAVMLAVLVVKVVSMHRDAMRQAAPAS